MRGAAAALLLAAVASACASQSDLQPGLKAVASRLRSEEAACTTPPRPSATAAVICEQTTERRIFAEGAPYLLNAMEAFSAQRRSAAQWLDQQNDSSTAATRKFDQTLATTLKDLKAREPLLSDPMSPLALRLAAAKPFDACPDQGIVHERVQCIADLLAPIWEQEARDTLDDFNATAKTILAAATEFDASKAPEIRKQNGIRYAEMLAQPQADLTRDLQAAIVAAQQRIDSAHLHTGADASETTVAADAAAPIVAAMTNATLAAAPGYVVTNAPASPAAQGTPATPPGMCAGGFTERNLINGKTEKCL